MLAAVGGEPVYRIHGLNFGPYIDDGEDPEIGVNPVTPAELQERLDLVTPHTNWVRTFSATGDLQGLSQMIHDGGNMSAVGAWIDDDETTNNQEIDALIQQAIAGHIDMAIVGSEALLRNDVSATTLIGYIDRVKTELAAADVSIPVTTADTYVELMQYPEVIDAVDVVFANIYPYHEGSSIHSAIAQLDENHDDLIAVANGKDVIISETGWPSAGQIKGDAMPSAQNAADYFLDFVSWAKAKDVDYFWFEAIDEPWKTRNEGPAGAHWGLFDGDLQLKDGMERVFNGETAPDGPPIVDFSAMPATIETNLNTFIVAGATLNSGDQVFINGVPLAEGEISNAGAYSLPVPLNVGANSFTLETRSASGELLSSSTKTVTYDMSMSTEHERLLYVDAVAGDVGASGPSLEGTIVIVPDQNVVLGMIPGKHVRGISPDGSEIYMDDRSVFSSSNHQLIRMLTFSQSIPVGGFVVSPDGNRLYSRTESVDVTTNTLTTPLPVDIRMPGTFQGAAVPGGPAITNDGRDIFSSRPTPGDRIRKIDTSSNVVVDTGLSGIPAFLSDITVSPDGDSLLVSGFRGGGSLVVADIETLQQTGSVSTRDFSGEIGFVVAGSMAVVGAAGNPANGGGGVFLIDWQSNAQLDYYPIPLADNLTTSNITDEIFVSTGHSNSDGFGTRRLGIDVLSTDGDKLTLTKTFFLGINEYIPSIGTPSNDQIRGVFFKPAVQIIDDGDPGFAIESGSWGTGNSGAGGDNRNASRFGGTKVARWTFTDLTPGRYRVSATWNQHPVRATDAPYTIFDGTTPLNTIDVNQQLEPTGSPDLTNLGVSWQDLGGLVAITSDTLIVKLSNNANGYVMADAIRIERVA
ncbi:MAG: hypothetical protein KDA93_12965 [Planctomycetaceae bacterium]|nr:hypothetical protein [Planctomycetaceae bacterium]